MALTAAYKEFEDKLYSLSVNNFAKEEDFNKLYEELLQVLPNKGKLYKYKALSTFHIDELEEKYVWFSAAKQLNDNKDCTFNANSLLEIDALVKFFLTDNTYRDFLIRGLYLNLASKNPSITPKIIEDCVACICRNGSRISKLRFDKFCKDYRLTVEEKQELLKVISLYGDQAQNEKAVRNSISNIHEQLKEIRNSTQVLSLTTSYDKDSMWAYYCNNAGICIEYDFSKIHSLELKKIFINTQKVRYGRKKKFSQVEVIKAKMEGTTESMKKADEMLVLQLLTKDKSWRAEEEWRTTGNMRGEYIGSKIAADIVSAIYLDYSILEEEKAKRIIELAKINSWKIYVRFFDEFDSEYRYDTIENINKLISQYKEIM